MPPYPEAWSGSNSIPFSFSSTDFSSRTRKASFCFLVNSFLTEYEKECTAGADSEIVKQLKEVVPAFIACGGDEVAGIDYLIAHKILRKFEQLNLAYIKDEIDGLVNYLEKLFGTGKTPECKAYLLRLKKTI